MSTFAAAAPAASFAKPARRAGFTRHGAGAAAAAATPTAAGATLRPVRAQDHAALGGLLASMSPATRRLRFHATVNPRSEALLHSLAQAAPGGEAFVAVQRLDDGGERLVGEARWSPVPGDDGRTGEARRAEFAIAVADAAAGSGVADALMQQVLHSAQQAGFEVMVGEVLAGNGRMAAFAERHGFRDAGEGRFDEGDELRCFERRLDAPAPRAARRAGRRAAGFAALLSAVVIALPALAAALHFAERARHAIV